MQYDEFKRHVNKAGLTLNKFAELIRANPASITNLNQPKKREKIPKNIAIIAALMGEMAENDIEFKRLLEELNIEAIKGRHQGKFGGDKQERLGLS